MGAGRVMVRALATRLLVLAAALRVTWLVHRRPPLDELIDRIRSVRSLPTWLRQPEAFEAVVNRWYAWLPPRRARACMKRSYLLLDLWSRCGLEPEFRLGVRPTADGAREGHAWLVAAGLEEDERDFIEAYVA